MNDDHTAFDLDLRQTDREGYVISLVITPKGPNGRDPAANLVRDIGRSKALEIAAELLTACNAPDDLLQKVRDLPM